MAIKTIDTLVDDINKVLQGGNGWDEEISKFFGKWLEEKSFGTFGEPQQPRDWLGLSAVGKPCDLQKWYTVNEPHKAAKLDPRLFGTFFYGDMCEAFVISLAMAAGHRVEGLQEPLEVGGIPGSGDCIIDGVVVDVKSANGRSFAKFKYHQLKGYEKTLRGKTEWVPAHDVDGFGYISQLSSYLYAYRDDRRVTDKENAAFLAINKEKFDLVLDTYNMKEELANKEKEIEHAKGVTSGPKPSRTFTDKPDGKSGNRMLDFHCSYCDFRQDCWPNTRTFLYSNGPRHLTKVVREPDVPELK